ncbi:MAG: hypothetical protein ACLPVO_02955 [Desulfomonilaceae bacterium]|jgi:hypothetical protein
MNNKDNARILVVDDQIHVPISDDRYIGDTLSVAAKQNLAPWR